MATLSFGFVGHLTADLTVTCVPVWSSFCDSGGLKEGNSGSKVTLLYSRLGQPNLGPNRKVRIPQ